NGLSASDSGRSSSGKSSSSYQRLSHLSDAPAPLRPSPSSDDIIQDLEDRLWEKEQEVKGNSQMPRLAFITKFLQFTTVELHYHGDVIKQQKSSEND
ncbi:hypothetical protein XENOCAPTIV_004992, partial [Xenoophorus captivus]